MKIRIILTDDDGTVYEDTLELKKRPKTGHSSEPLVKEKTWYRSGSTTEKIVTLIEENFFKQNRTIKDIITKLKSMDYHYQPKDLTLPLRVIVRRQLLAKTKDLPNGKKSKKWTYISK